MPDTDITDTVAPDTAVSDIRREPRPEKAAIVADVRSRLESSDAVLFTEYRGLNVSEMAELRAALSPVGATYKIYKNTLACVAARELELDIEDYLLGPTGLTFVDGDPAAVAKVLDGYKKSHDVFVIKGGLLGDVMVTPEGVKKLASLPSREEMLAKLGGLVQAPMTQMAGALAAPLRELGGLLGALQQKFAGLVTALRDQGGAGLAAETSAPAEPEEAEPEETETEQAESAEAAPSETEVAEAVDSSEEP